MHSDAWQAQMFDHTIGCYPFIKRKIISIGMNTCLRRKNEFFKLLHTGSFYDSVHNVMFMREPILILEK